MGIQEHQEQVETPVAAKKEGEVLFVALPERVCGVRELQHEQQGVHDVMSIGEPYGLSSFGGVALLFALESVDVVRGSSAKARGGNPRRNSFKRAHLHSFLP
jgi:hypothetical protein